MVDGTMLFYTQARILCLTSLEMLSKETCGRIMQSMRNSIWLHRHTTVARVANKSDWSFVAGLEFIPRTISASPTTAQPTLIRTVQRQNWHGLRFSRKTTCEMRMSIGLGCGTQKSLEEKWPVVHFPMPRHSH